MRELIRFGFGPIVLIVTIDAVSSIIYQCFQSMISLANLLLALMRGP
jgi:hypothetical protein